MNQNKFFKMVEMDQRSKTTSNTLQNVKKIIQSAIKEIEHVRTAKYTGWYILLKKDKSSDSGYKFVGFFNPDSSSHEPQWDVCMPIEEPESILEFVGW